LNKFGLDGLVVSGRESGKMQILGHNFFDFFIFFTNI